jgi:hypothetical protein
VLFFLVMLLIGILEDRKIDRDSQYEQEVRLARARIQARLEADLTIADIDRAAERITREAEKELRGLVGEE